MSIRSKILRELEKKPRRLKELKDKLGNDKKVQQTVEEEMSCPSDPRSCGNWRKSPGGSRS